MPLRNTPIKRKLMLVILITNGVVLFITCGAFFAYEFLTFREATVRHLSTLGDIAGANSTAALAFDNQGDAADILATLRVEPHIAAASLYDSQGGLFAKYPDKLPDGAFPARPEKDGYRIEKGYFVAFQAVTQNGKRLGTIYLKSDLGAMYQRFRRYSLIFVLVAAGTLLIAYLLTQVLQKQISRPILALAETARAVSEKRDYSVRAARFGRDELGLLTDGFNHMLTQIQSQDLAVRESEGRLRAVLDSPLSAVVVIDAQGVVMDWNSRAEVMFGWARSEVLGRDLSETIVPAQRQKGPKRGLEIFFGSRENPVLNRLSEMRALRRNDEEFPAEFSVSSLRTGEAVTFCVFITDITERKQSEEALRASEERYRFLFDNMLHGFAYCKMLYDQDGRPVDFEYLVINNAFERLTGLKNVIGRKVTEVIPGIKESNPEIFEQYGRVASTGRPERLEHEVKPLNSWYSVGVYSPQREHFVVVFDNITERKEAEARVQGQLGRLNLLNQITRGIGERQDLPSIFQVILRSLEDNLSIDFGCVGLYEPAGEILSVISVGERGGTLAGSLGIARQTLIPIDQNGLGRCVRGELVYEPDVSRVDFPFPRRLAAAGLHSVVIAPLMVEGNAFGVLVTARRAANSFSSADCEFLRQLTEHAALAAHQARLYNALQQAYDDLRQSQHTIMQQERLRALGQMASGIAHDINNAISPVTLYTESLLEREPNLSERARDYLGTIQRAIEDVAQTVSRMREFYRQREPQLVLAPMELNRLAQQVLDLTRARWRDLSLEQGINIQLKTELAPDLPIVMGAEGEIRDALTNLVFNAVDAMPEGGTLTLRTRVLSARERGQDDESAKYVYVEVGDTGVGMDEETRRRCLEPFFTTKGQRGTGLGLAMVYGMVQRHSAEVEIESSVGKGTMVSLIFPAASSVQDLTLHPSGSPMPARPLHILIVDDDPLLTKSLRDMLESDGHSVETADGGQAGIEAFVSANKRGEPFAAVITDLGMPYVDGRKVSAAIKTSSPATPVIMLTGWGQRLKAENEIPAHVDRVLNKPPRLNEIRAALAELTSAFVQK